MATVICLIALAASKQWMLHQLNVNIAFLLGDLKEEVYMVMHDGVEYTCHKVCELKKSLYGSR